MKVLLQNLLLWMFCVPAVLAQTTERIVNDGQLILQDVPEIPQQLVDRINQYQSIRSASFLDWSENGRAMFLRTRFGDVSQIHRMFEAGGARHQMTWLDHPVGQVARRSGGQELAFTMNQDGGEQDQIFLLNPSTGEIRLLTDGISRNRLIRWSNDGERIAFQSTRRNGSSNDVWIMDIDNPGQPELLVEAAPGQWWGPVEFSGNDRYLLVQQMNNVDDSRIHLYDLRTREMRMLIGSDEMPSANRVEAFDHDDDGFYFITNARGRAAELAWQSLDPEQPTVHITAVIPWDVTKFALSDDGKRAAFVTNENGISQLYLLNARSNDFSMIRNLPTGQIYNMQFHPGNRKLAFTLSSAQTPSDVFVLELGRSPESAKALQRWSYSEVGGLDTREFIVPELIQFPTFDRVSERQPRRIPAFVYRPKTKGPHPVIIHVHGGPEAQYRPSFSGVFQKWINELGAAVIAPNIRGSTGYDSRYLALDNGMLREDAIKDIGALLDWIAEQPELDESRVAIAGGSYGGYVVLASAVHYSDRLRAGINIVGISNFVSFLENTEDYRRDLRRYEYGDERDPEMRAFLEQISPLNNVERIHIPLLVAQGANDPRVPVSESEQIVAALREQGQEVWYIKALNEGHGFDRKENRDVYQQASMLFLQRYLAQ